MLLISLQRPRGRRGCRYPASGRSLSGDVTQDIAPSIGGEFGLHNINATRSGDLTGVGTAHLHPGGWFGGLGEAVDVLVRQSP